MLFRSPAQVITIDVGREHDVQAVHVIDALQKFGKMRREDIGKIEILDTETRVSIPAGKAAGILSSMAEQSATVNDFLVVCAAVKEAE